MALTATVYNFSVQLADIDRGVYENLEFKLARHPSETAEFMLARAIAYCLEHGEGIAFTEGIANGDEPAVIVRDLTGRVTGWIEVGWPDAERLHRGSKLAGRAAVYTHRDPKPWLAQLMGKKIHNAAAIPVYALESKFMQEAAAALERRSTLSLSRTEGQLYLDVNGRSFASTLDTLALP